jgi:hypothetical protein
MLQLVLSHHQFFFLTCESNQLPVLPVTAECIALLVWLVSVTFSVSFTLFDNKTVIVTRLLCSAMRGGLTSLQSVVLINT